MGDGPKMGPAEYLGHQLLLRLQETKGHVPRSVFFKTWCIADRYLKDELNHDISLPRYWYKYGEIVDETSISNDFYFMSGTPWGRKYAPVYDVDTDDFELSREDLINIEKSVKWAVNRFGKRDTQAVKSHQYTVHAPNEFIRTYSELRDYLDYTDLEQQAPLNRFPEYNSNQEVVEHLLDEMVIAYPESDPDFEKMHSLYLRWDDTARILLKRGPDYDRFAEFLDQFIEALSKIVVQIKYHEDIPQSRIKKWYSERENEKDRFQQILEQKRDRLLETREQSGVLNQISEAHDQTVLGDMDEMIENRKDR